MAVEIPIQPGPGTDAIVAMRCLNSLKHEASFAAMAACEAASPQVRQMFQQAAVDAIQAQGRLSQLAMQRGWYVPLQAGGGNMAQFRQNLQHIAGQAAQAPAMAGATV